jgi:hypothetical protein
MTSSFATYAWGCGGVSWYWRHIDTCGSLLGRDGGSELLGESRPREVLAAVLRLAPSHQAYVPCWLFCLLQLHGQLRAASPGMPPGALLTALFRQVPCCRHDAASARVSCFYSGALLAQRAQLLPNRPSGQLPRCDLGVPCRELQAWPCCTRHNLRGRNWQHWQQSSTAHNDDAWLCGLPALYIMYTTTRAHQLAARAALQEQQLQLASCSWLLPALSSWRRVCIKDGLHYDWPALSDSDCCWPELVCLA